MKGKIISLLMISLLTCCLNSNAQVVLNGSFVVNTGDIIQYQADFTNSPCTYTGFYWQVTGGVITEQYANGTTVYCKIQWTGLPGNPASVKLYGNVAPVPPGSPATCLDVGPELLASRLIQIGKPYITPASQVVQYGTQPALMCVEMPGATIISYQWQISSDGFSWQDISGVVSQCYQVPVADADAYYGCIVTTTTGTYTSVMSAIGLLQLDPGFIYSTTYTPPYNSTVTITATPVTGGYCNTSAYQYTWEQSVEGGPWINVGTGANYVPSNITGKTAVRRKVTCGVETKYTNTWVFNPQYITVDFENRNYVRTNLVSKKGVATWYQADGLPIGEKFQSTIYLDGMGRPTQSVNKEVSQLETGNWVDQVLHIEYDAAGRTEKSFLPYPSLSTPGKFKINARTEQENFIRTKYAEDATAQTFIKYELEKSPLGKIEKLRMPGTSWGENVNYQGVGTIYEYNRLEEGIRIWQIGFTPNSIPVSTTIYAKGKLFKSVAIDENQKKIYTYIDNGGKTILKKTQDVTVNPNDNNPTDWLCTYYVYDDLGQLRSIITPKAVKYLETTSWTFASPDVYEELCFYGEFDERGRLIVKHSPGGGQTHIVYDKKDRMVLSQDQNQRNRTAKQWAFFLYDNQGREVASGLYDNAANRDIMTTHVKTLI